jgi:hypothetical protein
VTVNVGQRGPNLNTSKCLINLNFHILLNLFNKNVHDESKTGSNGDQMKNLRIEEIVQFAVSLPG